MIVEIVSTGSELLLGQINDTNTPFLSKQCNEIGLDVLFHSTVGDNPVRMAQVFNTALSRADIVITTGGLGPTRGDITKQVMAELLGKNLLLHAASAKRIKCYFDQRHLAMTENNMRQAMLPEGGIILDNERGTAPGVIVENGAKTIVHLPGPPHELKWMFIHKVLPYFQEKFGIQGITLSKVLRTVGIGESALEELIKDYILNQNNPTIALLARSGEIHVRLTAKEQTQAAANALIESLEVKVRQRIGEYVFGTDNETLELIAGRALTEKGWTISLAESCTGGLTTSRITDVPGSSDYLKGSIVSYSNEAKNKLLGVPEPILHEYGAVSQQTAIAMAEGVKKLFETQIGVGITGIAGPGGATSDKPVGLVYIAVSGPAGTECYEQHFVGERTSIKNRTALMALNYIRSFVIKS